MRFFWYRAIGVVFLCGLGHDGPAIARPVPAPLITSAHAQTPQQKKDAPVSLGTVSYESQAVATFSLTPSSDITQQLRAIPGLLLRPSGGLGAYTEARLRGGSARQAHIQLNGVPLLTAGEEPLNLALLPSLAVETAQVDTLESQGLAGDLRLSSPSRSGADIRAGIGEFSSRFLGSRSALGAGQIAAQYRAADNDFPIRNPLKPFDPSDPERQRLEPRQNAGANHGSLLYSAPGWLALIVENSEDIPNARNSANNRARFSTRLVQLAAPAPLTGSQWRMGWTQERYLDREAQVALQSADLRQRTLNLGWDSADWHAKYQGSIDWSRFRAADQRRPELRQDVERWRFHTSLKTPQSFASTTSLSGHMGLVLIAEKVRTEFAGTSNSAWSVLPNGHIRHRASVGSYRLRSSLSYRERMPTLFEKYGDRGLFRGNPDLQAEKAVALEWEWGFAGRVPLLTVYHREVIDAITPQYNARGLGRSTNAARAQVSGINIFRELSLGQKARLVFRADWLRARDRSDGPSRNRRLPGHPEWISDMQLRWSHQRLDVRYGWHWESGAFYDSPNLLATPIVRQHDLHIGMQLAQPLTLTLVALNLGDNRHARFNGFPEPGRQFRAELSYSFFE